MLARSGTEGRAVEGASSPSRALASGAQPAGTSRPSSIARGSGAGERPGEPQPVRGTRVPTCPSAEISAETEAVVSKGLLALWRVN